MSAVNDIKRGREVLIYYHNEALKFPQNYSMSFQELIDFYNGKSAGQFLEGLGFAANVAEIPESRVQAAMEDLADQGEGKLPLAWVSFFNALSGKATQVDYFSAFKETVVSSAKDLGKGVVDFGNQAIETISNTNNLLKYVPYLIFAGGAYWLYLVARKRS